MGTPYLGEIRTTSFNFAPKGWALCNGQILPINQNQALFALLGTMYGGNGTTTFALPDLRGRVPMHAGGGFAAGASGGAESVALTAAQLPSHQHTLSASADFATSGFPGLSTPAAKPRGGADIYASGGNAVALNPASMSAAGSGQPHTNLQPYLTLNFIIALQGIFPSRS